MRKLRIRQWQTQWNLFMAIGAMHSDNNEGEQDHSKLNKFEMSVFNESDRYLQIHKLTDSKKLTVTVISFKAAEH